MATCVEAAHARPGVDAVPSGARLPIFSGRRCKRSSSPGLTSERATVVTTDSPGTPRGERGGYDGGAVAPPPNALPPLSTPPRVPCAGGASCRRPCATHRQRRELHTPSRTSAASPASGCSSQIILDALRGIEQTVGSTPTQPSAGPNTHHGVFESVCVPPIPFSQYMGQIVSRTMRAGMPGAKQACAVAVALMRRVAEGGAVPLVALTAHRLGAACYLVALKSVTDYTPSNALMAQVSMVTNEDLNCCERSLLCVLDWQVCVAQDEAEQAVADYACA